MDLRDELRVRLIYVEGAATTPLYDAAFDAAEPAWSEQAREQGGVILLAGPSWVSYPSVPEALAEQWGAVVPLELFAFPDGVGTAPPD